MVDFDASGHVKWGVAGSYQPMIATADGGVIATSGAAGGPATTFDASGKATGQMASLPTQSWTGKTYQVGSIELAVLNPINFADTFWPSVAANLSANSTAVIEHTLYVRSFSPWYAFGPDPLADVPPYVPVNNPCPVDCFLGDNRNFTTSVGEGITSRMTGVAQILLPGMVPIVTNVYSNLSTARFRLPPLNTATAKPTMSNTFVGNGDIQLHLAGANPLIPGSPDIDTHLDMSGTVTTGQACYSGHLYGDAFPNSEVFVINSRGQAATLVNFATSDDPNTSGLVDLFGDNDKDMGSFSNVCVSK